MAVAAKMAAAQFNTADHKIFDHKVVVLAGDGCLQEGVAMEAISYAGHNGLDNLILIYDSNDVTLDAMADATQSGDVQQRFQSFGWETQKVDGHDIAAFVAAYEKARTSTSGKPQLIEAKTLIGKGITEVQGTSAGHGEGGAKFAAAAHKTLGLPEATFFVSDEVRTYFAKHGASLAACYDAWMKTFNAWKAANPALAKTLEKAVAKDYGSAETLLASIPEFEKGKVDATRNTGGVILNALAKNAPTLVSGSADLHGSTKNYIKGVGDFTKANRGGHNLLFGIREHAMGAMLNGFAYYGIYRASGATFLTFADYMRGSIRLAALVGLPVGYIFTHDSIGVGEDGPTHQPVEVTTALRVVPNLDVIRPADAEETAGAFVASLVRNDGPTALILTRQNVPGLEVVSAQERRQGVLKGAYVIKKETAALETILLSNGSELSLALEAAEQLGAGTRVVSMPSFDIFERQPAAYKASVLPATCRKRVAVEAGVPDVWYRYVGLDGKVVSLTRFGISAPGNTVYKELGITAAAVVEAAKSL